MTLGQRLVKRSWIESEDGMRLSSGLISHVVIDASLTLRSSGGWRQLRHELAINPNINSEGFNVVAGPSSGADPICAAIMAVDLADDWLSVRKEQKDHGFDTGLLTGRVPVNGRVLLVDDVLTTGASILHAGKACIDAGLKIDSVLVVVDRKENNAKEKVMDLLKPIRIVSLYTMPQLKAMRDALS